MKKTKKINNKFIATHAQKSKVVYKRKLESILKNFTFKERLSLLFNKHNDIIDKYITNNKQWSKL